jgi:hypothetical protein
MEVEYFTHEYVPNSGEIASMNIKRAPRVMFSLSLVPNWRVRIDLARFMKRKLAKRFGDIALHPGYLLKVSALVVGLNGEKFLVGVRRSKCPPGNANRFWRITIDPYRFPAPARQFPEVEQERYANDLLVISKEVHAVLTGTLGVEGLRWWFVGWDLKKPGVRTPAELPWHAEVLATSQGS